MSTHFIAEYLRIPCFHPNRWMRKLYWGNEAFKAVTKFDHIKATYHGVSPVGLGFSLQIPNLIMSISLTLWVLFPSVHYHPWCRCDVELSNTCISTHTCISIFPMIRLIFILSIQVSTFTAFNLYIDIATIQDYDEVLVDSTKARSWADMSCSKGSSTAAWSA